MKSLIFPIGFFVTVAFAQETAPAQVEGVKGVEQPGAPKVKAVDPSEAKSAPSIPQAVQPVVQPVKATPQEGQATAVKAQTVPSSPSAKAEAQEVKAAGREVHPVEQAATATGQAGKVVQDAKATGQQVQMVEQPVTTGSVTHTGVKPVTPPPPQGVAHMQGVKPNVAGGVHPVAGVAGIDADKIRNLEAALQAKPQEGPVDPKKLRAAAQLLGNPKSGPEPKPVEKSDARSMLNEFKLPEGS